MSAQRLHLQRTLRDIDKKRNSLAQNGDQIWHDRVARTRRPKRMQLLIQRSIIFISAHLFLNGVAQRLHSSNLFLCRLLCGQRSDLWLDHKAHLAQIEAQPLFVRLKTQPQRILHKAGLLAHKRAVPSMDLQNIAAHKRLRRLAHCATSHTKALRQLILAGQAVAGLELPQDDKLLNLLGDELRQRLARLLYFSEHAVSSHL